MGHVLTGRMLADMGACREARVYFRRRYGVGTVVTVSKVEKVMTANYSWVNWFTPNLFPYKIQASFEALIDKHLTIENNTHGKVERNKQRKKHIHAEAALFVKLWDVVMRNKAKMAKER